MLQAGAIVQLKSGGPAMTVLGQEDGVIICVWFDAKVMLQTDAFQLKTLKRVSAPSTRR